MVFAVRAKILVTLTLGITEHLKRKGLWSSAMGCYVTARNVSDILVSGIFDEEYFRPTWWRHQMETFSALLALCAGNSPVTGEFPSQRPVTRSFYVFFDFTWTNNGHAGDLRCHHHHYDITVMNYHYLCTMSQHQQNSIGLNGKWFGMAYIFKPNQSF